MKTEITTVCLYARVSTLNHGQNPELQLRELRTYATSRGWTVFAEYVDNGVSGTRERRPELDRLMADAHRRRFDAVLVWKLDRFARSLKHLVNALAEFEALGVAFVSLRDNLDLTTPAGRLMFQIIGAMAEFERSLIQERVKSGMQDVALKVVCPACGAQVGTPCLGNQTHTERFSRAGVGRPRRALDLVRVAVLRESGLSWRAVGRELGADASLLCRAFGQRGEIVSQTSLASC